MVLCMDVNKDLSDTEEDWCLGETSIKLRYLGRKFYGQCDRESHYFLK
jgi:hypothetical protein